MDASTLIQLLLLLVEIFRVGYEIGEKFRRKKK